MIDRDQQRDVVD
uniref:Uncharacterized protein n=1 Tax=Arundo donax TaxID=35708 RepID=A0A0A8YZ73_ARUDO